MTFQNLTTAAQKYFPTLQIKYKDQNSLMKLLGLLLFFNPDFMKSYITTVGDTVYFPNVEYVKNGPISSAVILLHELVHMYDEKRLFKPIFGFLYLFPQILSIICIPLIFMISWKIFLPLTIFFLLPLPAFFRMYFEKRAYFVALYSMRALSVRLNFKIDLAVQSQFFVSQFNHSYYYFMWPFNNIQSDFREAVTKIQSGQRPFQDAVFDMIDDLVTKV